MSEQYLERAIRESTLFSLERKSQGFEKVADKPEVTRVLEKIQAVETTQTRVFDTALSEVGKADPQAGALMDSMFFYRDGLKRLGRSLTAQPTASSRSSLFSPRVTVQNSEETLETLGILEKTALPADELVAAYKLETSGMRTTGLLPSLRAALEQKQFSTAQKLLQQAEGYAGNPKVLWHGLVKAGYIEAEFVEQMDEMINLMEIGQVAKITQESDLSPADKQTVLAHVFLGKFEDQIRSGEINPVLIEEIVKGNFEFNETFFENIVASYLGIVDQVEKGKSKSKHSLLVKQALLAAVCTVLLFTPDKGTTDNAHLATQAVETREAAEQLAAEQYEQRTRVSRPQSSEDDLYDKPENSDVDVEKASKTVLWEIEPGVGRNRDPYFKERTSEYYDPVKRAWRRNTTPSNESFGPTFFQPPLHTLKREVSGAGKIDIPLRQGEMPLHQQIRVTDSRGTQLGTIVTNTTDYSFQLELSSRTPEQVKVTIPIGDLRTSQNGAEPQRDLQRSALDTKHLPDDIRFLIESGRDLPVRERAKRIEDYFKTSFIYSQDPRYSDFYDQAPTAGEYFNRLMDVRKGDCDVVNSLMAHVMRSAGINTKMAFGYINGGFLNKELNKLTALEAHGYVLYFDPTSRKWEVADGTPSKMDESTRKKFQQAGMPLGGRPNRGQGDADGGLVQGEGDEQGGEIESSRAPENLEEALEELKKQVEMALQSLKSMHRTNEEPINWALTILFDAALVGAALLPGYVMKRKMKGIQEKISQAYDRTSSRLYEQMDSRQNIAAYKIADFMYRFARRGDKRKVEDRNYFLDVYKPSFWRSFSRQNKVLAHMEQEEGAEFRGTPQAEGAQTLDVAKIVESATGIPEKEVEEEIVRRNQREMVNTMELSAVRQTYGLMGQFNVDAYFARYRGKKHHDFYLGPYGILANVERDKSLTTLTQRLEAYYLAVYEDVESHLEKADNLYQKKGHQAPPHTFPADYEEFRRQVPPDLDRIILTYWLTQDGDL